jgi:hypothetical protein
MIENTEPTIPSRAPINWAAEATHRSFHNSGAIATLVVADYFLIPDVLISCT